MKYEVWIAAWPNVEARKRLILCEMFGGAQEVYHMSIEQIQDLQLFDPAELKNIAHAKQNSDPDALLEELQRKQVEFVSIAQKEYPTRLREIYNAPYGLFYKGNLPKDGPAVAIVGARMCSEYGRSIASQLGRRLGEHKIAVISGMALGIDSASHAGVLERDGETYAVLGCGCDQCYPASSRNIYQNIQKKGGVLSEYFPGTPPLKSHFPERNRIISGLADVLVVVEAKDKSGSLITADRALEQGKDIFAVPGRIGDALNRGCNRLIAQGAGILFDVEDFLKTYGILTQKPELTEKKEKISIEKDEFMVYSVVDLHPKFINQIVDETGLHLLNVMHAVEGLKKKGLIRESFQNYYSRVLE